jgi:hypothetical protein
LPGTRLWATIRLSVTEEIEPVSADCRGGRGDPNNKPARPWLRAAPANSTREQAVKRASKKGS